MKKVKSTFSIGIDKKELARITPQIRTLYATGGYTQKELADLFSVSMHTVRKALSPEGREAGRRSRKEAYSARYESIIEEWKTGDYTLAQIAERWGRSTGSIAGVLRNGGLSAHDRQYRDKRIGELVAAGRDPKTLAQHYGIGERYIVTIAWRGSPREDQRICPICKTVFRPVNRAHIRCTRKCLGKVKYYHKICSVCGKSYSTNRASQQVCGGPCRTAGNTIKNIEVYLRMRELSRQDYTHRQIAEMFGMSKSSVDNTCGIKGRRPQRLKAIETARKHRGKAWVSQYAKLETLRALKVLEAEEGLLDALRFANLI